MHCYWVCYLFLCLPQSAYASVSLPHLKIQRIFKIEKEVDALFHSMAASVFGYFSDRCCTTIIT